MSRPNSSIIVEDSDPPPILSEQNRWVLIHHRPPTPLVQSLNLLRGIDKLVRQASTVVLEYQQGHGSGLAGMFVWVRTIDLVPAEWRSFPERWNVSRKYKLPSSVDLMLCLPFSH